MADTINPTSVQDLAGCQYVLLTTYTEDGHAKPTPVWAAPDEDALVVVTDADAGKVRRVRHQPRVTLSASSVRGHPRGAPVDGVAVVVEDALVDRVLAALRAKYGWQMWPVDLQERLRPSRSRRVGLVVRDLPAGWAAGG